METNYRAVAELVINEFWMRQAQRAALNAIKDHSSVQLYAPTEEQYVRAAQILAEALTPSKTELSLAGPAKGKKR